MKHLKTLLAVALLIGAAAPAFAQSGAQIITGERMKWARGISSYGAGVTDSTRISIPAAAAAADFADTTAWLDLGQFKFSQFYAKQPLVLFQITKQLTTTTDSIGYAIQYSNDLGSAANSGATIYGSVTVAYITSVAASTYGITAGQDGFVGSVVALSPDAMAEHTVATIATAPYRYVRLIVLNSDTSGATGRSYFSVRPVIYGSR